MPNEITTSTGMINRRTTQDSPTQVRKREALQEAAEVMPKVNTPREDIQTAMKEIEEHIEAIGKASMKLHSGERLAGFLSNLALCKGDIGFLRDEQYAVIQQQEEEAKLDAEENQ